MKLDDLLLGNNNNRPGATIQEHARVYVRVSHERSAEKGISPETQRQRIESYAKEHNYNIIQWYEDLGISAFRDDDARTSWIQMLKDAKADPQTSVIIVWRYDRFSRGDNAQTIQRDLLKKGVRIESAEEGYYDPDSEAGAIMMPLTWGLNRLFSLKLRNVVIPNMITNIQQRDPESNWAYKNGGWALFGYKKHRIHIGRNSKSMDVFKVIWLQDDRIFNGKTIAEWCRTMLIDWRLGERMGYDSIAAKLTAAGVPTASGKPAWSTSSIQAILGEWDRLWQYTGVAFWNRTDCTDKQNRKRRDPSEWIVVKDAHPAIISEEEAEGIWDMVESRKREGSKQSGSKSVKWALSGGYLKCGVCGANYTGVNKPAGNYYVCGAHSYRRGEGCVESWYIPRDEIESLVLEKILDSLGQHEESLIAWVDAINEETDSIWKEYQSESTDRKKALATSKKQLSTYLQLLDAGADNEQITDRIKEVSTRIRELEDLQETEKPAKIKVEDIQSLRNTIREAIVKGDSEAIKEILRTFVEVIVVDPKTKTLEGRLIDPRALISQKTQFELPNRRLHGGPKGDCSVRLLLSVNCFQSSYTKHGFWGQKKTA